MAPAWSRGLDKLVSRWGLRVVDNLQKKNKHHPLEKGKRIGMGGPGFWPGEASGSGPGGAGRSTSPCYSPCL